MGIVLCGFPLKYGFIMVLYLNTGIFDYELTSEGEEWPNSIAIAQAV